MFFRFVTIHVFDRQREFSSLDCVCIPCSAVKTTVNHSRNENSAAGTVLLPKPQKNDNYHGSFVVNSCVIGQWFQLRSAARVDNQCCQSHTPLWAWHTWWNLLNSGTTGDIYSERHDTNCGEWNSGMTSSVRQTAQRRYVSWVNKTKQRVVSETHINNGDYTELQKNNLWNILWNTLWNNVQQSLQQLVCRVITASLSVCRLHQANRQLFQGISERQQRGVNCVV